MFKEKVLNFLKSRYVLWVFAIGIQIVYTFLFWAFIGNDNNLILYLFGEAAIWASFIFFMLAIRLNFRESFQILLHSISEIEKFQNVDIDKNVNILARFKDLVQYLLNYMEHVKDHLNITEDKYRKYLRFGDISMDVHFEYDFKKNVMYLSGNYKLVFGNKVPVEIPDFTGFVKKSSFVDESQKGAFLQYLEEAESKNDMEESEWLLKKANGNYEWFVVRISYLSGLKEEESRILGIIRNINDIKQQAVELQKRIDLEPMTHLYHRDAAIMIINQLLDELQGNHFGVFIMIDIDDFKIFNDTFGHLVGDKIVIGISSELKRVFGDFIVARIGGDEFAIYMHEQTSDENVNQLLDNFLAGVQTFSDSLNLPVQISVSIGVTKTNKSCRYNELYVKADNALYTAKARGKNGYIWYDDSWGRTMSSKKQNIILNENTSNILFQMLRMNRDNVDVNEQLRYIGSVFNISHVSVYEANLHEDVMSRYAYYCEDETMDVLESQNLSRVLATLNFDDTGVYYKIGKENELRLTPYTSVLCYKLMKENALLGFLFYVQTKDNYKTWTQSEIEALRIAADTIASQLFIDKTQKNIEDQMKNLTGLLNAVPYRTLIIDPKTMELQYDNHSDKVPSLVPCYKALHQREEKCLHCPLDNYSTKNEMFMESFKAVDGEEFDAIVHRVKWDSKPMICLHLSEKRLSATQKRQRENERRISYALSGYFDYIIEYCPQDDYFQILRFDETDIVEQIYYDYDSYVYGQWQEEIEPSMREKFIQMFNKEAILNAFANGAQEVELNYRRTSNGITNYVKRKTVLLKDSGGKSILYSYVLLIDDIMELEVQRKAENDLFLEALAKTYMEIYEVDVKKNSFRSISKNESDISSMVRSGNFQEDIAYRCENVVVESDRSRFTAFYDLDRLVTAFKNGIKSEQLEYQVKDLSGAEHYVSVLVLPGNANFNKLLVYVKNIDQRKKIAKMEEEKHLLEIQQEQDARYRVLAEHAGTLVFEWNNVTKITYVDNKIKQNFAGNYDGRDIFRVWEEDYVVHPEDVTELEFFKSPQKKLHGLNEALIRLKKRNCDEYAWCRLVMTPIRINGKLQRILGTINDVTEEITFKQELTYRSNYDVLTGSYNIEKFIKYVTDVVKNQAQDHFAIVVLDVNRFKAINDIYGRDIGDEILRHIARIVDLNLNIFDAYCRMSGDVFAICIQYKEESDLVEFTKIVTEGIENNPRGYKITVNYGICLIQDDTIPIIEMVDWANLALKTVKGSYLQNYAFYDEKLRQKMLEEEELENEMQEALSNGQFKMYLQPKIDMGSNKLKGAEALIRWEHPTRGIIYPNSFIPLFERNGFVVELDKYIWEQACILLQKWKNEGKPLIPISVNVSRMNIYRPDFYEFIIHLIKKYDIPSEYLELELTESVFLEDPDELYAMLQKLRDIGFRLSMDDFGSGYSSLSMLRDVPIDVLKIDRGFLNEAVHTEKGKTIITFVVLLAQKLQLEVIAEGVENKDQITFLMDCGCFVAQGFYYSKPIDLEEFEEFKQSLENTVKG